MPFTFQMNAGRFFPAFALRPSPFRSRGLTPVELLAAITTIGILITLMLPAVRAAHEVTQRLQFAIPNPARNDIRAAVYRHAGLQSNRA